MDFLELNIDYYTQDILTEVKKQILMFWAELINCSLQANVDAKEIICDFASLRF